MFDFTAVRLLHGHGGNEWVPMTESRHHDAAEHDPERAWLRGARIFRCSECEEEIAVAPSSPNESQVPGENL
jgi:hypothetical protein